MGANLSVEFLGMKLDSPVILASGNAGGTGEKLKRIALEGRPGALTTTTICAEELGLGPSTTPQGIGMSYPSPGAVRALEGQYDHLIGVDRGRPTPKEWFDGGEMDKALEGALPVIVSIMGSAYYETWIPIAKMAEEARAAAVELNFCTPHGLDWFGGMVTFIKGLAPEITRKVKEAIKIPVIVKLPFLHILDFPRYIPDLVRSGADALTSFGMVPATYIDADAKGKQPLAMQIRYGCYLGSINKSIGLFQVQGLKSKMTLPGYTLNIPIIGTGGIQSGRDVIEYIMAGATLVGTHFLVPMIKGVGAFGKLRKELVDWLEKHGYESLDQIRGMALQYIGTENFEPLPAIVDEDLCNGCGDCEQVCYWIIRRPPSAISVDPSTNKAKVDENWCQGCGWCTVVCPQDALKLRGWA